MTSKLVSVATLLTLLAGDGLAGGAPAAAADWYVATSPGIVPAIDIPTSQPWGTDEISRRGGRAARIKLDDDSSTWYRLAYVDGGDRLQVFENYAATTGPAGSDMELSKEIAWQVANAVIGTATTYPIPDRARIQTGNDIGLSAGLMFTLSYIDLLTVGPLVGNLRVAGTGGIGPDGVVSPAFGLEVKVAAAMLTNPDVVFTTSAPNSIHDVTIVESKHTRLLEAGYTVGEWLNLNGFEQPGRSAAERPETTAFVVVHDLRQALAWLCGRTNSATTCAAADTAADIPIGTASTTFIAGYSYDHDSHHD